MEGKRLLRTLRLTNLLSYGPKGTEIELQPLNVLIGPNGSGKSNLIEAIALLKAAPGDITAPIRTGGGMLQWPYKGPRGRAMGPYFEIETTVSCPEVIGPLQYTVGLGQTGQGIEVLREAIEDIDPENPQNLDVDWYYRHDSGVMVIRTTEAQLVPTGVRPRRGQLQLRGLSGGESILSQRKDPEQYPEISHLGAVLSEIRLLRNCDVGPRSILRGPQRADEPSDFLLEDGRNLGIVLNDLLNRPATKKRMLGELARFYGYVQDITTKIHAGTVETFLHERDFADSTPSIRLSDGTLRYLCLLTVLCHPQPPPLVCIEDPEISLHPDVLPFLAELMIEASQKTQLVVTTHSDVLVSALSDVPEAVVVCERDDEGSHLRRLEPEPLKAWLEKYSLGELWRMGETGGNP
jgi:predicted ATPase